MSGMWQGALRIAAQELRLSWRGYLLTFLFLAYTVSLSTVFLHSHLTGDMPERMTWVLDLGYLTFIPLVGFLMDPAMFRYRREDTYSRKLAEWQTMPISVPQIVTGRMILLILLLLVNCLLYFGFQYAVLEGLRERLGPAGFILNFLSWFGYGVVIGVMMVYMELGYSGRVYYNFCLVFVVVLMLASLMLGIIDTSPVFFFLESAANRNWGTAAVMMAAAVMAVAGFGALLHRRINRRSFWT